MGIKLAYKLLMLANKKYIKTTYGADYYKKFRVIADKKIIEIQPKIPNIGESEFLLSYAFIIAYVPFFHAFNQFEDTKSKSGELVWTINENLFKKIPRLVWLKKGKASQTTKHIEKLKNVQRKGELGELHPMDWKIEVVKHSDGTYNCNMKECGALKVLKAIGEESIFPYPCRIDYLMANLSGNKFQRTKTLADGNECCDNHMMGLGFTDWSPHKGFDIRK